MKIVFMGTPQAAVPTLEKIVGAGHQVVEVWTQPDRPSGRGKKLTASPVKESAMGFGLPVVQPVRIKSIASRERFCTADADAAVVVAYGRILTKTYLEAFPMGCINVHFSILPELRGAAPVNWAIANGEKRTGVTTMQMDRGLDTGNILRVSELEIEADETAVELTERLSHIGADLLIRTLAEYKTLDPITQDESKASYAPMLSKSDGLVDWSAPAEKIRDQFRAFQPFPKSFSDINGKRLTFWKAGVDEMSSSEVFGVVIEAHGENLLISCGGNSVLRIEELQLPGKARMKTRDFLNGGHLKQGDRFDS